MGGGEIGGSMDGEWRERERRGGEEGDWSRERGGKKGGERCRDLHVVRNIQSYMYDYTCTCIETQ